MTSQATLAKEIDVPVGEVAELVCTVLASMGFRIEFFNERLNELTATCNKSERVEGLTWVYDYHATVLWSLCEDGTKISVEITERRNALTAGTCRSMCEQVLSGIGSRARRLAEVEASKEKPNRYGTARWAEHEDAVKAGYVCGIEDSRRFVVGPGEDGNYLTLTPEDTVKHVIVCGPTGSGKTTAVFIPNLIERLGTSVIVTEATAGAEEPDLYAKTSSYRQMAGGQKIYYFNPDDLRSDRINPIDAVSTYGQAQTLAQLIIDNTTSKNNYGDDVWPKSEANLLTILVAHAAAERQHLGYIRAILRNGPDDLLPMMLASKVERVQQEYQGFHNNSREGFKYGVFAGLMQRLSLWVNPRVVALTETTDINLEMLQKELFSFYLAVPSQKGHLKPLAALVFNFLLELALERNFVHPLYLSLDEFTNFGRLPDIAQKLSIIRHRNIPVVLGVQDFVQLSQVYGKDDATLLLTQPGTKIFFGTRALDMAEKISKMAGMTTVYERKMTSAGHIQEKESGRALIDPSEVMHLDPSRMLVFTPKMPPAKCVRFGWEDYESATCLGPVVRAEVEIDERLVNECEEAKRRQAWQEAMVAAASEDKPAEDQHKEKQGDQSGNKPTKKKAAAFKKSTKTTAKNDKEREDST